jgi:hypothetical protein
MQVQLSKQHRRRALDIISNSGSKNRQLPPTVVAARTMGAMLDLAPKQPGPTSPCVLPRHSLVRFVEWGEPKAELAITLDFHLDRCSSLCLKASPVCRLSRRVHSRHSVSLHGRYYRIRAPLCPVRLLKHYQSPRTTLLFHHICLFRQMHACSALSNSLALCQCTPAHTLAKWRSHAFSSPRMKRRLPPAL